MASVSSPLLLTIRLLLLLAARLLHIDDDFEGLTGAAAPRAANGCR